MPRAVVRAQNLIIFHFPFFFFFTDPPTQPLISGYVEGSIIPAGSVQKLLCVSSGGNPLATLTWYKNDKKVGFAQQSNNVCKKLPFPYLCMYICASLTVYLWHVCTPRLHSTHTLHMCFAIYFTNPHLVRTALRK